MTRLLLATTDRSNFADIAAEIENQGGSISWAVSGRQVLDATTKTAVDLVLTDETLADMTGLELIEQVVAVNPMINSAVVSSQPEDVYHEASEGLGILMQLSPKPDRADGKRLMAQLNHILGLTATITNNR